MTQSSFDEATFGILGTRKDPPEGKKTKALPIFALARNYLATRIGAA